MTTIRNHIKIVEGSGEVPSSSNAHIHYEIEQWQAILQNWEYMLDTGDFYVRQRAENGIARCKEMITRLTGMLNA